jgi:hypothetical protein
MCLAVFLRRRAPVDLSMCSGGARNQLGGHFTVAWSANGVCRRVGGGRQDGELEAGRRRVADGERWRQAGSKQWIPMCYYCCLSRQGQKKSPYIISIREGTQGSTLVICWGMSCVQQNPVCLGFFLQLFGLYDIGVIFFGPRGPRPTLATIQLRQCPCD